VDKTNKERSVERQIDDNLKKIFEEDVEQGLPPHLRQLLEQLDGQDPSDQDDDGADDKNRDASERTAPHSKRLPGNGAEKVFEAMHMRPPRVDAARSSARST